MTEPTSSPASTSALADDDPRAVFARAVALAAEVIDAVPADALDAPTPSGMNVRDLLKHLVMVLRRVACAGRGEDLARWPVDASDVADGGFGAAWRAAGHDVEAAWTDDRLLDRPTTVPWGTFPGTEVLGAYTNEVTVHTWDLARGTAQEPRWDETVLAVAERAIHNQLPTADRTALWQEARKSVPPGYEWADPFGPAVPVAAGAPLIDRLVAWNGRRP